MYAATYVRQKEVTILDPMLDAETDKPGHSACSAYKVSERRFTVLHTEGAAPTPPEALQRKEAGSMFESLLREAVTPEEHTLLCLIDELVDNAWKFDTGKALRGELRRGFTAMGFSERRFYAAFHGIEKRVCL